MRTHRFGRWALPLSVLLALGAAAVDARANPLATTRRELTRGPASATTRARRGVRGVVRRVPVASRGVVRDALRLLHDVPQALRVVHPGEVPAATASMVRFLADARASRPRAFTPEQLRAHIDLVGRPPREFTLVIEHDGRRREAVVHLPPDYASRAKMPLVLNSHGIFMNAEQHARYSGMAKVATARGLIAVHAHGTPDTYNGRFRAPGASLGQAVVETDDEGVGFVGALLDELEATLRVDRASVHGVGLSAGGFFNYAVAHSRLADRFASLQIVSGLDVSAAKYPPRGVALRHIHGTLDPVVGYPARTALAFNRLYGWPRGARESFEGYARNYNAARVATRRDGRTVTEVYRHADGVESEFVTIEGGNHAWPGDIGFMGFGLSSDREAETGKMVDFMLRSAAARKASARAERARAPRQLAAP